MSKINPNDYIEIIEEVDDWNDEILPNEIDKDYKKFEKIKSRKHHFKEGRNLDRIRDKQKNHRISTNKI